jgi:hypothetical protein
MITIVATSRFFIFLNAAPHSPPEFFLILGPNFAPMMFFGIYFLFFSVNCKICNIEIANWNFCPFL